MERKKKAFNEYNQSIFQHNIFIRDNKKINTENKWKIEQK